MAGSNGANRRGRTVELCMCALFTALLSICAQIIIPVGPVPVSLSLLPVLLCASLMDAWHAALVMAVYLALGLFGLPVFSGMSGGPAKLFGVTGGYIIGYLPCAWITSRLIERWGRSMLREASAMTVGVLLCYAFGTIWFMLTKGTTLMISLSLCVFPFLPADAVKIAAAAMLSKRLHGVYQKMLG